MLEDAWQAGQVLQAGGVVLHATGTVWGLAGDPFAPEAVDRIYALKRRDRDKYLLLVAGSKEQVARLVPDWPPGLEAHLVHPRATTIVYPRVEGVPEALKAPDGSLAIRVSRDPYCQALAVALGHPFVSTSANISGEEFGGAFADVPEAVRGGVDFVSEWRRLEAVQSRPSRILKFDLEKGWLTLRD